ncbi:hypothetical protein V7138_18735 [Bacillus sp. JJ1533]|uniref:hypothetical protein n=1 Tax=Bacillus sp. JJ1533 TaxID=3122959 RepID=UPI0030003173
MIQIHILQALMKSEAFQKLHSLSNVNQSDQKTHNSTPNLSTLLPVLKGDRRENVVQHSLSHQTDTVELTTNDSSQFLQQQITFQHPAFKHVSLQMDGRKKNGKIDPDFCHLFFSLELKYLREVVIDVKVQNRILSIAIYNDTEGIGALVEELKTTLQTNLEHEGYQLSSIKIVNLLERNKQLEKTRFEGCYERVDVKV